jgi:hypothetical protein
MKVFANPWVRFVGRAIIAGLAVGFTSLQAADNPFSSAALWAAAGAAFLAVIELITPLNSLLGAFKASS